MTRAYLLLVLSVLFWGEPLRLAGDGEILPAPPALIPFREVSSLGAALGLLSFESQATLETPSGSGSGVLGLA